MSLHKPNIVPFPHLFLIQASFRPDDPESYFLNAVQQIVDSMIPDFLWHEAKPSITPEMTGSIFNKLEQLLPLIKSSKVDEKSDSVTISYLCPAACTHHARRFVFDTLRKELIPGKQMEMQGGINLCFKFSQNPSFEFYIAQEVISIRNSRENQVIRRNLPDLITHLKQKLPSEFHKQKANTIHPIFMPRNEEELIRNLIVLAKQIKYVRDLPQVSIHFEKQTQIDLTFTVIVARLLKGNIDSLGKLLEKSSLRMDIDDIRIMGYLKQKYPKEAAIFRITIDKSPFFRPDYSVDLLRARQKIVAQLGLFLGSFRDFNGGMIFKQEEALNHLRQELEALSEKSELILENYFYSLKPGIMQTVHDSHLLKKHFQMLIATLESNLNLQPFQIIHGSGGKFLLCFIAATDPSFKDEILNAIAPLEISPRDLTISSLEIEDATAMGFILKVEHPEIADRFEKSITEAFHKWTGQFYCSLV